MMHIENQLDVAITVQWCGHAYHLTAKSFYDVHEFVLLDAELLIGRVSDKKKNPSNTKPGIEGHSWRCNDCGAECDCTCGYDPKKFEVCPCTCWNCGR
jgi:hypothetical protein